MTKLTRVLFISLFLLSIFSLFVGVLEVDFSLLKEGRWDELDILFVTRFPRLMAILATGVGMSLSGFIMQLLCNNKFVSPSTGATIASARLGILVALLFLPTSTILSRALFASACAMAGTTLFLLFTQKISAKETLLVPLVGIMFGNILTGLTSFLSYTFGMTQAMSSYMVGSFSGIMRGRYEIVYLVAPLVLLACFFANHFTIVGVGKNFATNLGLNPRLIQTLGLLLVALITSSIVVVVGSISYIGLLVPNIITLFKGDNLKGSMLDTALLGALFVLICDVLGRLVAYPYEVPIELIIGIVGSLLFLAILWQKLQPRRYRCA